MEVQPLLALLIWLPVVFAIHKGWRAYFLFDSELLGVVNELRRDPTAAAGKLQPKVDKLRADMLVSPGPKAFGEGRHTP